MNAQDLAGRRILLVEDEYFQAVETRMVLEGAGAEVVGPAAHEDIALNLLDKESVDAAVVDINLGYGASFKVAHALESRGVPYVFLTGYSDTAIPAELAAVPRIEKPAANKQVVGILAKLAARSS